MKCRETNINQAGLTVINLFNCGEEDDKDPDMTGNTAQIAEQNINFHKELHNTTIMWSMGGMIVMFIILVMCGCGMKLCGMAWRHLTGGPGGVIAGAPPFRNGSRGGGNNTNNV